MGVYVGWCSGCSFGKASLPRSYRVSGAVFWVYLRSLSGSPEETGYCFDIAVAGLAFFALLFFLSCFQLLSSYPPHVYYHFFPLLLHAILHISRTHMHTHIWGSCSRSWFFLHIKNLSWRLLNGIYLFLISCVCVCRIPLMEEKSLAYVRVCVRVSVCLVGLYKSRNIYGAF